MAPGALNRTALIREKRQLGIYRTHLPALDQKRRQLLIAKLAEARAERTLAERAAQILQEVADELPMLADAGVRVEALVSVVEARSGVERALGVDLPVLEEVTFAVAPPGSLRRPHWADRAATLAQEAARLEIARRVARRRLEILEQAAAKASQRVNLFEKVLIPETEARIRRIEIQLADSARAGVVAAKAAKAKRREEAGS